MNEIGIGKAIIMRRTTALAVLGVACLMTVHNAADAGYRDGMNLYQYVESNPTTVSDPHGLWTIVRNGKPTADAVSVDGDTLIGLATQLRLNEEEVAYWAKGSICLKEGYWLWNIGSHWGKPFPQQGLTEPIKEGQTLTVPNTVLGMRGNSYDWAQVKTIQNNSFTFFWDKAEEVIKSHRAEKYYVLDLKDINDELIKAYLSNRASDKNNHLYIAYFFGHGSEANGAINTSETRNTGVVAGRYTSYGIRDLYLYSCGSLTPDKNREIAHMEGNRIVRDAQKGTVGNVWWRLNVSKYGKLHGYVGEAKWGKLEDPDNWKSMPGLFVPKAIGEE